MNLSYARVEFVDGRCDGKITALPTPVPHEYSFRLPRQECQQATLEARRWGLPIDPSEQSPVEMIRVVYRLTDEMRYRFDREEPCL